jgi:NDP-sugar pyrophosphorylase family protein
MEEMAPNKFLNMSPATVELVEKSAANFFSRLATEREFPDRLGIVLAAGAATRFRPLTASRLHAERGELANKEHYSVVSWNKASLPIANRPLISYTIEDLINSGFRYIIINVSQLHSAGSVIEAALKKTRLSDDIAITFLVEECPSGTYGGVIKMLSAINKRRLIPPNTDVAVFSGDIYTEQPGYEILRFHREKKSAFTLMLNKIPDDMKGEFGTVEINGNQNIMGFHEKKVDSPTNLNNSSRYIAKYNMLESWASRLTPVPADKRKHTSPDCFFDFGLHIFTRHLEEIKTAGFYGFVSDKRWADLGRIADFHDINMYLLHQRVVSRIFTGALVTNDCVIGGNYTIRRGSTICNRSTLTDVSIGEGWIVNGATLERTVLMPLPDGYSYEIGSGVHLKDCVVGCGNITTSHTGKVIVFNGHDLVVNDI